MNNLFLLRHKAFIGGSDDKVLLVCYKVVCFINEINKMIRIGVNHSYKKSII